MKDKNMAGIMALLFGWMGLHRFYLGQKGWGIFYIVLCVFTIFTLPFVISLIDAMVFFTMDKQAFDEKYNSHAAVPAAPKGQYFDSRHRPTSANKKPSVSRADLAALKQSGVKKFKEYDMPGAIEDFEKVLEIQPNDVAAHFNLACAYSHTEQKEKSFRCLQRAVELGFRDFDRIKTHEALSYLRIQTEFETFEKNHYRLPANYIPEEEVELVTPIIGKKNGVLEKEQEIPLNLLDQFQQLARLRDKGILDEAQFEEQKQKLLVH